MTRRSPLNRTTAPQIIRLFDVCFRQGVFDACDFGDDIAASDWLAARLEDGKYGLLSDVEGTSDWKFWRLILYRWCRNERLGGLAEKYIDLIQAYKSTFVFVLIPITMRFYLMGVEEWLAYPNQNNIALFRQTKKIHWKVVPKHLKFMRTSDFISYVQEFVYERLQKNYENDICQSRYDSFVTGLWACTQKYYVCQNFKED